MRERRKPRPPARGPSPVHAGHALGRLGESWARAFLLAKGWTVLERNYRFGRREVDLIVRRGDLVAFVEVKTRAGARYGAPEDAVTRLKRREIELVAQQYLVHRALDDVDVRFDVVSILAMPDGRVGRIVHLEDAWRPEGAR